MAMEGCRSVRPWSEDHGDLSDRNVYTRAGWVFDDAMVGCDDGYAPDDFECRIGRVDRHQLAGMFQFGKPGLERDRPAASRMATLRPSLDPNQHPFEGCIDDFGVRFNDEIVLAHEYRQPGDSLRCSDERNQVSAVHRRAPDVREPERSQISGVGFPLGDLGFRPEFGPDTQAKLARELLEGIVRPLGHGWGRFAIRGFTRLQSTDSLIRGEWTAGRRLRQLAQETQVSPNGREPW